MSSQILIVSQIESRSSRERAEHRAIVRGNKEFRDSLYSFLIGESQAFLLYCGKTEMNRSIRWLLAFGGVLVATHGSCRAGDAPVDPFEAIAQQQAAAVPGIVNNPAPKLPSTTLPWDAQAGAGFTGAEKMHTQAQLDAELARMRQQYEPFMADLAPPLPKRPTLELEKFDWRYAAAEDKTEPTRPQQGLGPWQQVAIPHYVGPPGKATSFYRSEVVLDDALLREETLYLHFQGVDYYADVYVNGQHVGAHEGLFDPFEFDIKSLVKPGKNVILVKVGNDGCPIGSTDPHGHGNFAFGPKMAACGGPGWDDPEHGWNCCPVGFGLWQRAWIEARPAMFVHDIFVRPMPQRHQAEVWLEIAQDKADAAGLTASYSLYGQNFKAVLAEHQPVTLGAAAPEIQPGIRLQKFVVAVPENQLRWWSPDEPWLYQMQIQLSRGGHVIDSARRQFGMRTFAQSTTSTPKGRLYLNGKEIRLRGADMMGNIMQCVMRKDFNQLRDDILLAKIAHMNFWRMTQQPCQEEAYDYFDRLGLMAQSDLPTFAYIPATQGPETVREAGALFRLVRSHPCNVMVSYINEPMTGNKAIERLSIPNTAKLFRACDELIPQIAPDQTRKWVDGDYANMSEGYSDHHCYTLWYTHHGIRFKSLYEGAWISSREGWMHGCGEYGAEGMDSIEFMQKHYPKSWLPAAPEDKWVPDKIPGCQTARGPFHHWIGSPVTMADWVSASRDHQMWAVRLMTEAYRRDARMNSCAVHLLIDAWPDGWLKALMDYDRQAKPAYFAFRDALAPMAANLRPDRWYWFSGDSVRVGTWICNDTQDLVPGATVRYQVELAGKTIRTGGAPAQILAREPAFQGFLEFPAPSVDQRQPLTVRVGVFDAAGNLCHDSSVQLDLFPDAQHKAKLDHPGGHAQALVDS
jgi:hypothetical protein